MLLMRLFMFSPTTPCTGSTRALIVDFFTSYYRFAPRGWGILTLLSLRVCVFGASMAESMMVLVKVETASGMRNRPVTFLGGREELLIATKEKFNDILSEDGDVYLQILDQTWGDDVYVDLQDQDIPARSILKAVEKKVCYL